MNQDALTELSTARSCLLLDHPFFGVLALRLALEEDASLPTLAVNGKMIKYNPDFISSLSPQLRMSAVAHEVMHCVLEHPGRLNGRSHEKWNIACDYALNPILKEAGMQIGEEWLYNADWAGKSADEIYNLLPDGPSGDGGALCEIHPGDSGDEDTAVEWRIATIQAAKIQQEQGTLPASLRKLLDDALCPTIPWRDVLSQFMTEKAKDDYSWRRPNPYYAHTGLYLPIIDGVGMGEVVIALDTSGSVMDVIDEFGATVRNIIDTVRPQRTHVVYCDAAVNHVDVFERGQSLSFEAVGGGGTDFRPAFEYVKNNSINPACMLYLTDMYGVFPQDAPDYPVLWCASNNVVGPFGQTVQIKTGA